MIESTELVPTATVASVCQAYADSRADVLEAFCLLNQTQTRLRTVLVNEYPHFLPSNWYLSEHSGEECVKQLRREAWGYIYRKTRVWEVCSIKQRDGLERELSDGQLPEVTELNVLAFLQKLQDNLPDMFEQALTEVFDWLRPQRGWGAEYKTNNRFEVGKKVILGYCVDQPWGHHYHVYYGKYQHLQALDNVFHLLDGHGIARHPNDIVTAINAAGDDGGQQCETEYFQCKWYANGNLHITFKRLDLVKELNKHAGARGLNQCPPQDGHQIVPGGTATGGSGNGDHDREQDRESDRESGAGPVVEAGPGPAPGPGAAPATGGDVPPVEEPGE